MTIEPRTEHDRIRAFYDDAEALLDGPEDVLHGVRAEVSAWSPAQHVMHICKSNGGMLKAVQVICEGGEAAQNEGEPNEHGRRLLESGRFPPGAEAPSFVRPPDEVSREDLEASLERGRAKLADVEALLPQVAEAEGRVKHPSLGMLGAGHWLRMASIHSQHHQGIIARITARAER